MQSKELKIFNQIIYNDVYYLIKRIENFWWWNCIQLRISKKLMFYNDIYYLIKLLKLKVEIFLTCMLKIYLYSFFYRKICVLLVSINWG